MRQLPLPLIHAEEQHDLAGTMPAVRAAMRRAAGAPEGEGRKALPDAITDLAKYHEICLTTGSARAVKIETINKWLSPSDTTHPPSILAVIVFCIVTRDVRPLLVVVLALGRELSTQLVTEAARVLGLGIMTEQDKEDAAYGRACRMEREARRVKKRLEENMR